MTDTEFISGRKLAKCDLGRVLILGLGVSGKACALYLAPMIGSRVRSLSIFGGSSSDDALEWIGSNIDDAEDLEIIFDVDTIEGSFDLCIASPGISEFSDLYQSAKNASSEIVSEVEFAWRESTKDSRWVAVTGTNGKTTTTSLIAHILKSAGERACAVGNIGDTCIEAVGKDIEALANNEASTVPPIYVVETSSYQLASIKDFAPEVAVILGITPDHLTWHRTHENYIAAKYRLLSNLRAASGVAVLDAVNDTVRSKIREIKSATGAEAIDYIPIGTAKGITFDMRDACASANAAFVDDGAHLHVACSGKDHVLIKACDLKLEGAHNRLNALAAASACVAIGLSDEMIDRGLRDFAPLEHRIEPAGNYEGVDFYNDSKATNVDATLVAIPAFLPRKPIVMLGGRDKLSPLDELVEACGKHAKAVVCYGESQERFLQAFEPLRDGGGIAVMQAEGMDAAFDVALRFAEPGDVVLLSPACASFDEFSCFEERGEHFKELVAQLGKRKADLHPGE